MKENVKPTATHPNPSSFFTLVTGWMQQGVESFFATQRILVDLAMRQNLNLMKTLRDDLSTPEHSPVVMLTELAAEGTSTFIEAQRILLDLAHAETEIVMGGVKQRIGDSMPAVAMTETIRRSIGTFIAMQRDFLNTANKQATHWLHAVKAGKAYDGDAMIEIAREAMDNFVHAQKKFLDVIAEETSRATSDRPHKDGKMMKKTEVSELAHEAATAFLEAQKKLLDVAGRQMNVNLQVAGRALKMMKPLRLPLASLTGEGVKSFVDAEKALIDNMMKRRPTPVPRPKATRKPARHAKKPMAMAAKA
jgi:hypothetical protein